jgi:hypothetical protein
VESGTTLALSPRTKQPGTGGEAPVSRMRGGMNSMVARCPVVIKYKCTFSSVRALTAARSALETTALRVRATNIVL